MIKRGEEIIGIDLGEEYALISYYREGMDGPETFSKVAGEDQFLFPVQLYRLPDEDRWLFGEQAVEAAKKGNGISYRHLLHNAYHREPEPLEFVSSVMEYNDLLGLFLTKLLGMLSRKGIDPSSATVVLTVAALDLEKAEILFQALESAGVKRGRVHLIDYEESFAAFVTHQTQDRWMHDVVLFHFNGKKLEKWHLTRNENTIPQTLSIQKTEFNDLVQVESDTKRDQIFQKLIEKEFYGKSISTVYLVGEGFEGGWLEQSLLSLCRQRKAYMGKNLFTKGACFSRLAQPSATQPVLYLGNSSMKINLTMKVMVAGKQSEVSLISAGDNCYEAYCACDVILDEDPYLDICVRGLDGEEEKISSLELSGLPERPRKATKLHLQFCPVSDKKVKVVVEDRGLGELYPASNKSWSFVIS